MLLSVDSKQFQVDNFTTNLIRKFYYIYGLQVKMVANLNIIVNRCLESGTQLPHVYVKQDSC